MTPEVERLVDLLDQGDDHTAVELVHALVFGGIDPQMLVDELLVPVQRRIGVLIEHKRIDDEVVPRSAAFVDGALEILASIASSSSLRGPAVVVACPPGEWHTLPARMVATVLRCDGWNARALPVTRSIAELVRSSTTTDMTVLLSCTMTNSLFACAHAVDALHRRGATVIVGGSAFGADDRRARAVGADARAESALDAAARLRARRRQWTDPTSRRLHEPERRVLANATDSALRILHRSGAPRPLPSSQDLTQVLLWAHLTLQLGEDDVLSREVGRWRRRLVAGGQDDTVVAAALEALAGASPPGPLRGVLLAEAAAKPPIEGGSAEQSRGPVPF